MHTIRFVILCFVVVCAVHKLGRTDPPLSMAEVPLEGEAGCGFSVYSDYFGAASSRNATVTIDSGSDGLAVDCGFHARNMPRLFLGMGFQVAEGVYHLSYQSDSLASNLDAEGGSVGLSFFWKTSLPKGVELFGSMHAQWVGFFRFDVRDVQVSVSGEGSGGKFDVSDFAKQHIAVSGGLTNLGLTAGLRLSTGSFSFNPLFSLESAIVSGSIKTDMTAQNLLTALNKDALSRIDRSNMMLLTGLGTSWCSGGYCFFALFKGGMLATDHWAVYGQAGVKVFIP